MSKKFLFLISLVLALSLASAGYGESPVFKLDFDDPCDPNAGGPSTDPGFTSFLLTDSGSEVNGVIIDLGGNIEARRRDDPNSNNELGFPIIQEEMYEDFIFAIPPSGIEITLWGLGAGRECKIYIYAYDNNSKNRRVAEWTANGAYLLTTDFEGGDSTYWPFDPNWFISTARYYDFNGIAHADELGSISLVCTQDPCNYEDEPFGFANALIVIPYGDYNDVEEAQRPQPFDEEEDVSADTVLSWIAGAYATKHDVYLGTDFDDVNGADASDTTGIYRGRQDTTSYDPPGLLELDRTYYWRVDEVNDVGGLTIWPGEVYSFTTSPYFVVENFNSYEDTDALEGTWDDYYENDTAAFLDLIKPGDAGGRPVLDGNSAEYSFLNHYSPHYSLVEGVLADLPSGITGDWLGMNVKSLALWFYGEETNPVNSQMYVNLTDDDSPSHTATVAYGVYDPKEDMNDIKVEEWQEWNIALTEFLDDNPDVNLANVKKIDIGFGDGGASDDGVVYFDDIIVHTTRCVLVERPDDFAKLDFAPGGEPAGDCIIDYLEISALEDAWLFEDRIADTNVPTEDGLVVYYSMETMTGADPCDPNHLAIKPYPYDPCKIGFFSEFGVTPSTSGVVIENDPNNTNPSHLAFDANCVYFDGAEYQVYANEPNKNATAITCGQSWSPLIDGNYSTPLTLAVWIKWKGPHQPFRYKCQPIISMRKDWKEDGILWFFECDTYSEPRGSFGLREFANTNGAADPCSVYTPANILNTSIGKWAHLAATYDGTEGEEACKLYLNAAEVASGPFSYGTGDPCDIELTLGNHDPEGFYIRENFYGNMDEVYIFNRVLGPNEIAYLADTSPADGKLQIPIPSGAEIYEEEPVGERIVNFKDFSAITDRWLEEQLWP